MKKLLFFFIVLLTIKSTLASTADILNKDPWRVLQYKFVNKPQKLANGWKNLGIKGIGAVGAGAFSVKIGQFIHSYIFGNKLAYNYKPKFAASKSEKATFYSVYPLSLLSAITAFLMGNELLVRKYQKVELVDFLRNWDKYLKHIPQSLIGKLKEVHQEYLLSKDDVESQADEIIDVIVSQINLHFYGDPKATNFFDIKYFTANFNTHCVFDIARIIESLLKVYKTYTQQGN